jgi:predicted small lipoprotein YifL
MKSLLASCLVVALLALPACGRKQEKAETSTKVTVVKAEHKQTRTSGAVQKGDVTWDDEDLK